MAIGQQESTQPSIYSNVSRVEKVEYGHALVAARDLEPGTIVEKFEGPDVVYEDLSDYDKTYVLNYQPKGSTDWKW
ncbi:hypothetical protein SmJEL517_g02957 [Synchytrium microbalum]|uniref:Uncharacterized protein n=1 Tax=Synchytrium microbalum TaxID=1806994 RepID=A0A507C8R9_9FUNG|nr:uncharacterized protein SmJEL517_g02957 [Synchytrium microbalum]TPX34386.1 hypothetical protein SmJEL517_g02957 [Synchytrium microbalum]